MIRLEHLPADVLELSPLARAVLSNELRWPSLRVPRRIGDLEPLADRFDEREREGLARSLERHLAPLTPHVAMLDAIRSLRAQGACTVVTGQQPGFLTSPLYSLYKALQAVRLARELSTAWQRPVIALFWNHADDHDVAEVHHAYLQNRNLDLQKIALAGLSSGRVSLARIVLDENEQHLSAIRALIAQTVDDQPFGERALDVFMPRSGETFARAFTRSFTELLGPQGLVVLEPDWIRGPIGAALARIVAADPLPELIRGADEVRAHDHAVAIEPAGAALLYRIDEKGARLALRAGGDGFRYDGESGSRTLVELAAEIVDAPLAWSPGALLRPIVQDLCLPVAAYIGGYGELAYHAELALLRTRLDAPHTPFVPRVSCTLVDPECRLSLAKLGIDVADVLRAHGSFTSGENVADAPAVIGELRAVAERAAQELAHLRAALGELDPSLVAQIKRTADQMRNAVDKLAEKSERVHQNKSGKGKRHDRRLNNTLCPRGEPQERVLGPVQFVARFGEDWIGELVQDLDPFASEHLVVHLGLDEGPHARGDDEPSSDSETGERL